MVKMNADRARTAAYLLGCRAFAPSGRRPG